MWKMMFKASGPRRAALGIMLGGILALSGPARAQDLDGGGRREGAVRLAADRVEAYTLVERSDWSRYDNGKYSGHVYHEVRASIKPEESFPGDAIPVRRGGRGSSGGMGSESFLYRGNFFVLEETLRDMRASARPVDAIIPVSFRIYRDGSMVVEEDQGFPSLRGFPAFPPEAVSPGARWTAQGQRAADPRNTGNPVLVPFIAEYQYQGPELYRGIAVHRVSARYATRYRGRGLGGEFSGLQGSHAVDILIQAANGLPLLIRDNLDETFAWPDGSTLRLRGFTLIFSEGAVPLSRETVIASLGNSLGIPGASSGGPRGGTGGNSGPAGTGGGTGANGGTGSGGGVAAGGTRPGAAGIGGAGANGGVAGGGGRTGSAGAAPVPGAGGSSRATAERGRGAGTEGETRPGRELDVDKAAEVLEGTGGLDLVSVPEGVRLIVRDIRFIPDSDEFLPEERPRLDSIAQALKEAAPRHNFLVEGHTASVGRPTGEQELSVQRAKRMVEELARRGIPEDRFIYKGWGGTKPVGDNSNEQGRSLNRRVEITILD
jgi:outer membrane protein OmpA-like peptidoglycan-associated protein